MAGVCGAHLTVLTVARGNLRQAENTLSAQLQSILPAGSSYVVEPRVRAITVTMGQPVDAILDEAKGLNADLIVAGTHSKSGLSRWLLGSTSAALLEQAHCPVMLVPPGEHDIVQLGPKSAHLSPGAILAAVDLGELDQPHLALAGQLSTLADQPMTLMTVAPGGMSDEDAAKALRELAGHLGVADNVRTLVRRGAIASEIDHAALAEHAGLVVMGLRTVERGTPGAIASAVLDANDAVVVAVPQRHVGG